jgi:hypothetical protein
LVPRIRDMQRLRCSGVMTSAMYGDLNNTAAEDFPED